MATRIAGITSTGQPRDVRVGPTGAIIIDSGAVESAIATVSGNITASGGTVSVDVGSYGSVAITMVASSLVGHVAVCEGSVDSTDGVNGNWGTLPMVRTSANTVEYSVGALSATTAFFWRVRVDGIKWLRIRATAHTSGTATWFIRGSYFAEDASPVIPAALTVTVTPVAASNHTLSSAATTNATSVKTSSAKVSSISASNGGAAAAYLKMYNKASAPTVGTDIPVLVIPIPASSVVSLPSGPLSDVYNTGLAYAITNLIADTDTTAVAAGQVKVKITYL